MDRRLVAVLAGALVALVFGACGASPTSRDPDDVDGGSRANPADEDGDTVSDEDEGRADGLDTDNDGVPDYRDPDSDGDGIPDRREAGDDRTDTPPLDSDGDGDPDLRDTDADGNGRPDRIDGEGDVDGDERPDFADLDDDDDGMSDRDEIGMNPATPLDTDGDGTPDFRDVDSDADTISDAEEGVIDADRDQIPAYRDTDSDGDCIPDRVEAGDADLATPARDGDDDRRPDFLDRDSDNDGLLDGVEDVNCNGVVDAGESSAVDSDTDNDGVSDLVEVSAGTDPTDPGDNPAANGDFVFEVPYMDPPNPLEDTLDFSTEVSQADVVFAMDTTGSMGGEIDNLKTSVSNLANQIRNQVPNTAFGVVAYQDFPTVPFGVAADQPFVLRHRVMTMNTNAGLSSLQVQVNGYSAVGGYDVPESGWEMLYQVATGQGTTAGGANVPRFNPASAYPASPPAGEQVGTIGGVGYRVGSLPIVIAMTDSCSHNSDVSTQNNYTFSGAARGNAAITALQTISARAMGVLSGSACSGAERAQLVAAANATGATVPPTAWGTGAARPAGCGVGLCCTGKNGAGEAPDASGRCPLVFSIDSTGAGLGSAVADAVEVLTGFATLDIAAEPQDDPSDAVDAVAAFVERVEANPSAGAPCASGLRAVDVAPVDGVNETFDDVTPGTTVCFDVVPKINTTVPPLETPQMFKATVAVQGDGVTTLDTRDIYFLVPPEISDIPVE